MRLISWLAALVLAGPVFAVDVTIDYGTKTPVPKDYTACLKAVKAGETVYLAVGVKAHDGDFRVESLKGVASGRYKCWKDAEGTPVMQPAAEEVRPFSTFPATVRGGLSDGRVTVNFRSAVADHHCPNCGGGPWYTIYGFNADGTHSHRCGNCGNVFSH